jgi:chromatin remodeling complex protein RSC6
VPQQPPEQDRTFGYSDCSHLDRVIENLSKDAGKVKKMPASMVFDETDNTDISTREPDRYNLSPSLAKLLGWKDGTKLDIV